MEFLLEPGTVFLNHGSYGACPRDVHEEYQRIQRRLEAQPVRFMKTEIPVLLAEARQFLSGYIGADAEDVVFVPNPTFAVNEIARSLQLAPGDEVLLSDHEYGACHNVWRFLAERRGFALVEQPFDLPVTSDFAIADQFWSGVTEKTKVIFLSHITSPTALTLPVEEICRRARSRGTITIIDGAHAPGQIDLDVTAIGADFYTGTCHKWLCAPKGAAFLHARREVQDILEPLIVGWGWGTEAREFDSGSNFLDYHEWLGTHDPSAYLTVPKAIEFQAQHDWAAVQKRCHQMAIELIENSVRVPAIERVHPNEFFHQMALLEVFGNNNAELIKTRLYERQIEVPVIEWKNRTFIRVSIQAYNTTEELELFVDAIENILRK